jgi:hypothetical protein
MSAGIGSQDCRAAGGVSWVAEKQVALTMSIPLLLHSQPHQAHDCVVAAAACLCLPACLPARAYVAVGCILADDMVSAGWCAAAGLLPPL